MRTVALYPFTEQGLGALFAQVRVPDGVLPEIVTFQERSFLRMPGTQVRRGEQTLPIYRECSVAEGEE